MYNLTVKTNAGEITQQINRVVEKQIPFAVSMGLNELMFSVQKTEVMRVYDKAFTKRNKQFALLTNRVFKSNKSQLKRTGFLTASIQRGEMPAPLGSTTRPIKKSGKNPLDTSFMLAHAQGGVRKAKRKVKFVPMTQGGANITRNKTTGRVSKSNDPKVLYNADNTFVGTSKRSGKSILFKRQTKKRIVPMYHFQPSIRNTRKYNIDLAVEVGIRQRARFHIAGAYIKALKKARFFR